ncbi:MAG TPA: polysaccharide deacetylase family protein [Candidatus Acidoferrum sp.]|nr:polysaccharide deacetylase family protein [Candidatus Acidoferrum sp.]
MNELSTGIAVTACAAAGTFAWGAFAPWSQLFGRTIRFTNDPHSLALTFDDGPNPAITPSLLELLDRHNAKATFFLIGRYAAAEPALVREIAVRGHAIGNHTYTHPNLAFLSRGGLSKELQECDDSIESIVGRRPERMRPPFGARSPILNAVVHGRGGHGVVMWSKWARDWTPQPAAPVINRLAKVKGGDVLLLHDGDHRDPRGDRSHTVEALAHWLPRWKDAGLQFVTLDGLHKDG